MFIFVYFFTQTDPTRRIPREQESRRELSNAYFLAKFGSDAAENEPCKVYL
jgi:hypothetical protein